MRNVRVEVDIAGELELGPNEMATPTAVWFSGSSVDDVTIEFRIDEEEDE